MQGRKFAVQLLDQTEQAGSYSNLLLDHALHQVEMDQKEKNLCTVLFYGVLTRRITLDAILKKYSKKPVAKYSAQSGLILQQAFISCSIWITSQIVQQ